MADWKSQTRQFRDQERPGQAQHRSGERSCSARLSSNRSRVRDVQLFKAREVLNQSIAENLKCSRWSHLNHSCSSQLTFGPDLIALTKPRFQIKLGGGHGWIHHCIQLGSVCSCWLANGCIYPCGIGQNMFIPLADKLNKLYAFGWTLQVCSAHWVGPWMSKWWLDQMPKRSDQSPRDEFDRISLVHKVVRSTCVL